MLLYDERDPDAAREALNLTADEAEALATLLGAARITRELTALQEQVSGLLVEWLPLPTTSPYAGRTLGETLVVVGTPQGVEAVAEVLEG